MIKDKRGNSAVLVAALLFAFAASRASAQSVDTLLRATAVVRGMEEAELVELVPKQSGLQYVGCPNCDAGRQERQLVWSVETPDEVFCQFCEHRYPSEKYPMDQAVVVKTPREGTARFPYWADETGYRYFFQSRRDDEVRKYLAKQTLRLARLYAATGDAAHARRAAVILNRFADVFPHWCYHYDYPFRQKVIYDGNVDPSEYRPGFRTARWNWWAYYDIPLELLNAYVLIRESDVWAQLDEQHGVDVAQRIEDDLFRNAGRQVYANRDDCTNMSPAAWTRLIRLGRVLDEPRYIHAVVDRLRRLIEEKFFYDGFWYEGSPSYARATVNKLMSVVDQLQGYTDPPGYVDPIDGTRYDQFDAAKEFPELAAAQRAVEKLTFPHGGLVPVHDTWAAKRQAAPFSKREPFLLPGLGHACLGGGAGDRLAQWHLSWSGGYGHQHADLLTLSLFAHNRELLSDVGYTHTAYRSWTVATAAHNTVVIDGQSQQPGNRDMPTDGRLEWIDLANPRVQLLRVDGRRAYPEIAQTYRRTLLVVDAGDERRYAVDLFDVEGGAVHDYFLHGNADEPAVATTELKTDRLETLLPAGTSWAPTQNEGQTSRGYERHYAYGFLQRLQGATMPAGQAVQATMKTDSGAAAVRTWLFPESDSRLVLGENPSIRHAQENDALLGEHWRPFLMVRRTAAGQPSRFISLFEPYVDDPFIRSASRLDADDGTVALKVDLADKTHFIVIDAQDEPVKIAAGVEASFRGDAGLLSLHKGRVDYAYAFGDGGWKAGGWQLNAAGEQRSPLVALEDNAVVVESDSAEPLSRGDVIRLITSDGWAYPLNVARVASDPDVAAGDAAKAVRIVVAEGPAMRWNRATETLKLQAFPGRQHEGAVEVQWQKSVAGP